MYCNDIVCRSLLTELAKLRNIVSKQALRGNHPALLCCILVLCFAILIGQFHPITYQSNHEDHYTATGKNVILYGSAMVYITHEEHLSVKYNTLAIT